MRRVVVRAPGDLRVEIAPEPEPAPGEALLRPLAIGVCGSDLHVLGGHHPFVEYPVEPGHEIVAEVLTAPEASGLAPGDRVALEPSLPCGRCRACREGSYNVCAELRVMGFQAPGGMAERFAAPADRLHRLPDRMDLDAAVLVEPVAVAVRALRVAERWSGGTAGRDVGVVGAGAIGLLVAQVARAWSAARVGVAEIDPQRREIARALGFDAAEALEPLSLDVALECVGAESALRGAIDAVRKGGAVVVAGVHGRDPGVQAGLIQDREIALLGTLMYKGDDMREAIRLLAAGAIDAKAMITDRFPLERAGEAFERAKGRGGSIKVVLGSRQAPDPNAPQIS